jgi:hypothetical protein
MSAFEFANSNCGWCHPGGGPLEYDRAGYRYDNQPSGLISGGTSNPDKDSHKGDYYAIGTNQTTKKPEIQSRIANWQNGGVAEADCLMCHLQISVAGRYANLERNYVLFEPPGPTVPEDPKTLKGLKNAATMGLARTNLLTNITLGSPNVNPNLGGWSWAGTGDVTIPGNWIGESKKENCAICHFPDRSWFGPPGSTNRGPIDTPLGFTSYQKLVTTTSGALDDDFVTPAPPTTNWFISNGRTEGGKRAESINDPTRNQCVNSTNGDPIIAGNEAACTNAGGVWIRTGNPDAHMKSGGITACSTCHYALSGDFPAKKDSSGNEILPAITGVLKIDHQFAKGDAFPDTKNMDQMDYTATCESCHITRTHPNSGNAPIPSHAGLPAIHLNKIACKTCHIPIVNGPVKQLVNDFTAGPFRGFARAQIVSKPGTGVGLKPLYVWQSRKDGLKIVPAATMVSPVWANDMSGTIVPTFQRLARALAVNYRAFIGDQNSDGRFDWTLNAPQNGTSVMIVNTVDEISGFIDRMKNPNSFTWQTTDESPPFSPISNPVMNMYVNLFSISHNVQPIARDSNGRAVPGDEITYYLYNGVGAKIGEFKRKLGPLGINGCIECHSSSDPNNPNYSPKSVGFFDKTYELFAHPEGIKQVEIDGAKKVYLKPSFIKGDGSPNVIDLGSRAAHGANVPNTVSQAEVLGYSADKLAKLTNPNAIAGSAARPKAKIKVTRTGEERGQEVEITDQSVCPTGHTCSKELKVGSMTNNVCNATTPLTLNNGTANHTFTLAAGTYTGMFCAQMKVTDNTTGIVATHTVPIRIVKKNEKPTITIGEITVANGIPTIHFTTQDSDDDSSALQVRVVWQDRRTGIQNVTTVAGDAGSVTKPEAYPNVTKTYNVRLTVIDTKGGRNTATAVVNITATP